MVASQAIAVVDNSMLSDHDYGKRDTSTTLPGKATLTQKNVIHNSLIYYPINKSLVVLVSEDTPSWIKSTRDDLWSLLDLLPNWDSYGAQRISEDKIVASWQLLLGILLTNMPRPSVIPTNTGGVQLEWHSGNIDIELEVFSSNRFDIYFEDLETGDQWEREDSSNLRELKNCIELLSSRN